MYLDYSKLEFDANGIPETPELVLKTMSEETIGTIPGVSNLRFEIKFSEPSEISFDVASTVDGKENWIYQYLVGYKIIYTKHYGVYMIMSPSSKADGVSDIKHISGVSIENELETKKFFLEEGTFKFYDQTDQTNPDTVIGRILEIAVGWRVGYVSPALAQRYRTFDQYDDYLLSFMYNKAKEQYRCVFVFDPYEKTINAYDADEERSTIPIYLDFDNLLTEVEIEEISDELVTAISPYGADDLDIRAVNPIGSNWIYDLSYFISNGDIPDDLAEKWIAWQRSVLNNQEYYKGLVALQASSTAQLLAAKATLADLNGEVDTLTAQQSITIQAFSLETTDEGKKKRQEQLDDINEELEAKNAEVLAQEELIQSIQDAIDPNNPDSYTARINAVVEELSLNRFFTDEEYATISKYFIEQDITENTFVASTVDTTVSGVSYTLTGDSAAITGSAISFINLSEEFEKTMYVMSGGTFKLTGNYELSADVIRGTVEMQNNKQCVISLYAGTITVGDKIVQSGIITISGSSQNISSDVHNVTVDEITTSEGTSVEIAGLTGAMYISANVSDYQKYSVQMELFDYATSVLADVATPTYEFSVNSGNFVFADQFAPFRDNLELGRGVYLNVGDKRLITPYIIEFTLDFEDRSKFSLVFSNRFKRHDNVDTLKDMVEKSYSAGRSFNAGKHIYNQTVGQASMVSEFMSNSLDAAKNTIIGASNQSVLISGAGINVGGNSKYQLRIVDSMIAMTDDNWSTAKLAIGRFASPDVGEYWGVNAEVIGGKLIVGNNLIVENEKVDSNGNQTGIMQFKVDSTGAWLYNSTFVLESDTVSGYSMLSGARASLTGGGKIILDPKYGIAAGTGDLFSVNGTTVYPSFIDDDGRLILDKDNMPENSSFYIDLRTGNAYFRGNVYATDGVFNGTVYAKDGKFTGEIEATSGTFSGTIKASTLDGTLVGGQNGGAIKGVSLDIGDGNYIVDSSGNVTMNGNINLSGGAITWGSNAPVKYQFSTSISGPWHDVMSSSDKYRRDSLDGGATWGDPYQFRGEDGANGRNGSDANVTFNNILKALQTANSTQTTFITADSVGAPTIYGAKIYGAEIYAGGVNEKGGQVIGLTDGGIEIMNGKGISLLTITKADDSSATIKSSLSSVTISAPYVYLGGATEVIFDCYTVDFSSVTNVTGLTARFG